MSSKPQESLATIIESSAPRPIRKAIFLVLVVALIAAAIWYWKKHQSSAEGQPNYVTEPVKKGRIALIVTASGNLAPINEVVIGSELSGTVNAVYVDTNDTVKKGQPLAQLDTVKLQQLTDRTKANLQAAVARVSQAKATLAENQAALARQEELHQLSGGKTPSQATLVTSRAAVTRAEADLQSAEASVSAVKAELISYERDLRVSTITSPVNGVVLARSVEIGQTVAASFTAPTLFTIAEDLKKMELAVNVTEADIGRIKEGLNASFNVDAWPGRSFNAKVKKVALGSTATATTSSNSSSNANASNGVVNYKTELDVDNEDNSLRPGMTATVDIAIEDKRDILVVPNAALRFDPETALAVNQPKTSGGTLVQNLAPTGRRWRGAPPPKAGSTRDEPRVWILKDGKPVEIRVTPGITDGKNTEIISGDLPEGSEVIVSLKPTKKEE